MYNLYDKIINHPANFRQLKCGESLTTIFNCPLESKFEDAWSHHNYIVYVVEGRKIWHTAQGSYDLREGSCVWVRKGACVVEQFFETVACFILFFVPDEFICDVLKRKTTPIHQPGKKYDPVMEIDNNESVQAFYQSMMPLFNANHDPDASLIELKFRELILTLAENPANRELLSWFCSLLQAPRNISLQSIMEENFCFNLTLSQFARLSARSLSSFKRDFQKIYDIQPAKWLMEKRLNQALHLLTNMGKSVSEAAFESGFESPAHFSRCFRQRFGASPLSLKQQIA